MIPTIDHTKLRDYLTRDITGDDESYCDYCGKIIRGDGAAKARYAEGIFCSADCADGADMPHTSITHEYTNDLY